MAKDRELQDHERAHTGKAGAKVRHGQDAIGKITTKPSIYPFPGHIIDSPHSEGYSYGYWPPNHPVPAKE